MAKLFKDVEICKKGVGLVEGSQLLQDKIVALYYSAHWCPPCVAFTPKLKIFYEELNEPNKFEIVFISNDMNVAKMLDYFEKEHGDWCYLPFENREKRIAFSESYNSVGGVPCLTILSPNGEIVEKDARDAIEKATLPPADLFKQWLSTCP